MQGTTAVRDEAADRDGDTLLAYEYRAMEKLHRITKKKVTNAPLDPGEEYSWRECYCLDMRTRTLHGPEDYFGIDPEYRLWIWPQDLNQAVGRLNLTPTPRRPARSTQPQQGNRLTAPQRRARNTMWNLMTTATSPDADNRRDSYRPQPRVARSVPCRPRRGSRIPCRPGDDGQRRPTPAGGRAHRTASPTDRPAMFRG